MSLSPLPLSYCTNVHPGRSLAEVEAALARYAVPLRNRAGGDVAAGLWLPDKVAAEVSASAESIRAFADRLASRGLTCYTLNAFPFGDFHGTRVKENVSLPDWADPARLRYTQRCAEILAALLPAGVDEGSISTSPLGFKTLPHPADFVDRCVDALLAFATFADELRGRTGKTIRLAVEPEPIFVVETTAEAIAFFKKLFATADARGASETARRHLGLCYDICHQAVEFENAADAIAAFDAAGVRINKVHLSCALQLDHPDANGAGRDALRRFVEPRYLHQTTARTTRGDVARFVDLSETFINNPPSEFRGAEAWRIHYHVPIDADRVAGGALSTTRPALRDALAAVARLDYAPHLEVETYTWELLPDGRPVDLVDGLAREMVAARVILSDVASRQASTAAG